MPAPRLRALAAAAVLLLAIGIGIRQAREPGLDRSAGGADVYRSTRLEVLAPRGDLGTAPVELSWRAVPGASTYAVEVLEVDHNVLWRTTVRATRAPLPATVAAACVPGKTILWRVTARAGATVVADSGTQKFRVRVGPLQE